MSLFVFEITLPDCETVVDIIAPTLEQAEKEMIGRYPKAMSWYPSEFPEPCATSMGKKFFSQIPWDPNQFIGFSAEQIELIRKGWGAALRCVYEREQSCDSQALHGAVMSARPHDPQFANDPRFVQLPAGTPEYFPGSPLRKAKKIRGK